MPFLNETRLRNYPKLFFIAIWGVILINVVFHRGWVGRFGGIIGVDFVCIYSGGWLYQNSIQNLYDIKAQALIQQELFQPTQLGGTVNIFTHTPYAALVYSMMTYIPVVWAFIIWTLCSIFSSGFALLLIYKYILPNQLQNKISPMQLTIVVFSSFPFLIGILSGQSQSFTFLLMTSIAISMMYDRWLLAGVLAGMLIYKPHFIIGYLILWVVWKKYKPILGFSLITLPWIALDIFRHGFQPYQSYLKILAFVTEFANAAGINWEITPYALIHKFMPPGSGTLEILIACLILGLASLGLAIYSYRNNAKEYRIISIILATFFPYIISPRILLYDLLPITLIVALWSRLKSSKSLLYLIIFLYISPFILPIATKYSGIALLALIPLIILIFFLSDILKRRIPFYQSQLNEK